MMNKLKAVQVIHVELLSLPVLQQYFSGEYKTFLLLHLLLLRIYFFCTGPKLLPTIHQDKCNNSNV